MLKRVDNAVFDVFSANDGFEAGIASMGLANGGVGYALDDNNAALVTEDMIALVDAASQKIIAGEIVVQDYMADEGCEALDF